MRRVTGLIFTAGLALAACGGEAEFSTVSADAGTDFAVAVGEAPVFDGCDSTGEISNYEWTILRAPDSQPDANGKELRTEMGSCDFQLENTMIIDDVGEWTIELVVTNGDIQASDEVVVTVTE